VLLLSGGGREAVADAQGTPIRAKALTNHQCDSTEWHFVINQIDSAAKAPQSITVKWANGDKKVVPLSKFKGGVAHFVTTSNLNRTVVSARAEIYSGWSGQFNLSHGPCGGPKPTTKPTETHTTKPTVTPTETHTTKPTVTPTETHTTKPTVTPTETHTTKPTVTPTETHTLVPVPTAVPAGTADAGSGNSSAGLLGLVLVATGAVAGTVVVARRRFLHDS
jgi:hypothetical protein